MPKLRLLLVDDELDLLMELKPLLERSGYVVDMAQDGERALAIIATQPPDLVVLDVLMPHMDGRETLRRLRGGDNWTPVILLSRVGTTLDHALSLQEGADDYINKPFDPMELIARIQAVLRRSQRGAMPLMSYQWLMCGDLSLDRQSRRALLNSHPLNLSSRALNLLEYLMLKAGETIAREKLLDQVWGWTAAVETRAVDIRIAELRKALNDDASAPRYLETVIGFGYRFVGKVEGR
ncbi:MAG: response regulator transcription factor [Burkholderiales bacterium]|nr:response regulator transcription factor [Anaerolineae bacterium]